MSGRRIRKQRRTFIVEKIFLMKFCLEKNRQVGLIDSVGLETRSYRAYTNLASGWADSYFKSQTINQVSGIYKSKIDCVNVIFSLWLWPEVDTIRCFLVAYKYDKDLALLIWIDKSKSAEETFLPRKRPFPSLSPSHLSSVGSFVTFPPYLLEVCSLSRGLWILNWHALLNVMCECEGEMALWDIITRFCVYFLRLVWFSSCLVLAFSSCDCLSTRLMLWGIGLSSFAGRQKPS